MKLFLHNVDAPAAVQSVHVLMVALDLWTTLKIFQIFRWFPSRWAQRFSVVLWRSVKQKLYRELQDRPTALHRLLQPKRAKHHHHFQVKSLLVFPSNTSPPHPPARLISRVAQQIPGEATVIVWHCVGLLFSSMFHSPDRMFGSWWSCWSSFYRRLQAQWGGWRPSVSGWGGREVSAENAAECFMEKLLVCREESGKRTAFPAERRSRCLYTTETTRDSSQILNLSVLYGQWATANHLPSSSPSPSPSRHLLFGLSWFLQHPISDIITAQHLQNIYRDLILWWIYFWSILIPPKESFSIFISTASSSASYLCVESLANQVHFLLTRAQ